MSYLLVSAANTGTLDASSSVKVPSRVRRAGGSSNYWWIPGGGGSSQTYGIVSCGNPGRPRFGSSLFESVRAGALVVHSCIPGYKLIGARLRLCQSNGRWTPQLPLCVCELLVDCIITHAVLLYAFRYIYRELKH